MSHEASDAILQLAATYAGAAKVLDARLGAHHGLSYAEVRLLATLASAPDSSMRPGEIASHLSVTPSGVTRAVIPLQKRGIVVREPDSRDARAGRVRLSPAGRQLAADAARTVDEISAALLRRLSLGQIRQLERLLGEIS